MVISRDFSSPVGFGNLSAIVHFFLLSYSTSDTTRLINMFLKSILLACLVVLVACQPTENYCSGLTFYFYNGYGEPQSPYPEQKWDWATYDFDNGSGDTFDGYFLLDLTIGNTTYYSTEYSNNPVDFTCDIGNLTSAGYASYTYNLTDSIQLFREFYAPRSSK